MAAGGLLVQTRQLRQQHRALPFAQAVIGAVMVVAVEPFAWQAPTIMRRARHDFEVIVIAEDDAAFAGCHRLAGLEAESAATSQSADLAPAPFAAVRMRRVFQQSDAILAGDGLERVHIGGTATQMHGDDGFTALVDGGFRQFRINTVVGRADVNQDR